MPPRPPASLAFAQLDRPRKKIVEAIADMPPALLLLPPCNDSLFMEGGGEGGRDRLKWSRNADMGWAYASVRLALPACLAHIRSETMALTWLAWQYPYKIRLISSPVNSPVRQTDGR